MKTLTLLILVSLTLLAQDQSVYTLTGQKDSRLDARYSISYVATNVKEGCGSRGYTTGTMKPSITQRSVSVPDGNYTINLPIYMTPEEDKNGCGYRFGGLELIILRKNDHQYSRFQLLGDYTGHFPKSYGQTADVIYQGSKGGMGSPNFVGLPKNQTPIGFRTDKKYFRIAPETTFVCMTQDRIYEYELPKWQKEAIDKNGHTDFICTMQMKLDTDGGKYHYHDCPVPAPLESVGCFTTTNPDFGVNEIMSDTLRIDIFVDESKCKIWRFSGNLQSTIESDAFREIPKTSPKVIESLKSPF